MTSAMDEDHDVPRRPRGRPKKDKKADAITDSIRVPLATVEMIGKYQQWQLKRFGIVTPRKDIVANAIADLVRRKDKEPVRLTLLTGDERAKVQRFLRYLATNEETDRCRIMLVRLLDIADACMKCAKWKR